MQMIILARGNKERSSKKENNINNWGRVLSERQVGNETLDECCENVCVNFVSINK